MKLHHLILLSAAAASGAEAHILVDQNLANTYAGYYVGGSDWTAFTSALAATPGGYVVGSVANAADVAAADSILLVGRSNFGTTQTLTAPEIVNLTAFLAAGKRVAAVGDGVDFIFGNWTNSIVSYASAGTATPTYFVSQTATAIPGSELTQGVSSVLLQGAATVNGGTALFSPNWATLWGTGSNLLTVLDVNALTQSPGPQFRDNIATWLAAAAAPVPEPASWAMMIAGFGLVGSALRRSRPSVRVAYA